MHHDFESIPKLLIPLDTENCIAMRESFCSLSDKKYDECPHVFDFLGMVFDLSPYLKDCAFKSPDFISKLFEAGFENTLQDILKVTLKLGTGLSDEAELMKELRIQKRKCALLCGLTDLGGWWNGDQVTSALSDFASASLNASLDFVLLSQHNTGKLNLATPESPQDGCGFIILGMGKLGGRELNYSSDIDLIFFFDSHSSITLNRDDPITLLSRMAKQLVKIMQERTAEGYVFRMDIRLRPDPSSTPLVIPVEAALNYYEGQGQNWERAAMIKARAIAGDIKAGQNFLKELEPFIWRKYLDFAAINDVQSIKRQIHAHKGHGEIAVYGHNIKLGRGGIREIEFFAQTQQLIAGGRNPALRENETILALNALTENRWIEEDAAVELSQAYWTLRNLEHRLQMVRDEQTHGLPEKTEELKRIAHMSGEANVERFSNTIRNTLEKVERYYSGLFEAASGLDAEGGNLVFTGDGDDPETLNTLKQMGYLKPEEIIKTIKAWHVARFPALRATQARELLTELVPGLLKSFSSAKNPDEVVFAFDRFISGLPAGIQLFAILKTNLALADLLVKVLSAAPRLAEQIAHKPHLFDAMIDPQFGQLAMEKATLENILGSALERSSSYEAALDEARRFFQQAQFMIGCQYFSGAITTQKAAEAFSILAEVMVSLMLDLIHKEFSKRHGGVPGTQICILGMGRLGSRELTATSDLDLIFLYDYDESAEVSDGEKPLPTSLYFIRLMQRFIAAMSSPTAEGKIFELDFRLRPSGNAGPLATHVDAFFKYQRGDAWIWEAQALTRARPVAGDKELCSRVGQEIPDILTNVEKGDRLRKEILDMRMRIEKEKGSKDVWNVKSVKGGILDIEFIAQWLALENGNPRATATCDILLDMRHEQLVESIRDELLKAHELYTTVIHIQRICIGDIDDIASTSSGFGEIVCSSLDLPDLSSCKAHLGATQKRIRAIFTSLLKDKKDPEP